MNKFISKETDSDLTKLGIYQIAGGVLGIVFILWGIYASSFLAAGALLLYLFILLFFCYSIFCGILCVKAKKNALAYSLANQILQLLGFAMKGFAFKYIAGFFFSIGLDLTPDSFNVGFGAGISKFELNFNNEEERLEININLVALGFIYWIDKLMKRIKEESTLRQVSSIGTSEMEASQPEE
jgi:hypothetical protein